MFIVNLCILILATYVDICVNLYRCYMPAVYINLYQKLCINLYSNNMSIYNIILETYLSSRNLCMNIVVMLYGAVICISNGTFICIKNLYQVVSIYLYCCNLRGDNKKFLQRGMWHKYSREVMMLGKIYILQQFMYIIY